MASYNDYDDSFESTCKIGTGFKDEDLIELTEKLKENIIQGPRNNYRFDKVDTPDIWLDPIHIWGIYFDSI